MMYVIVILFTVIISIQSDSIGAVSYTHLDVYKRQGYSSGARDGSSAAPTNDTLR